jgi:poly(A) polymerase
MNINENARTIIQTLIQNGHEAVLAGGCVRDFVLGLEPNDWDIATSAEPKQIESIFPHSVPVGKYFGVITVIQGGESFEVATFRTDGEYKDGRKPSSIRFSSMKEDALRRDLTINGMFYDISKMCVVDYVGGQDDLSQKKIQFIGSADDRIKEDHLRILRAIRFSLRLGFSIEPTTMDAIRKYAHLLNKISSERIRDELDKIFSNGKWSEALQLLADTGILVHVLPDVEAYRGCNQNSKYHPEGDVWNHTLLVMNHLPLDASKEAVWGVLLHDVGKPKTSTVIDGEIKSPMHEAVGEELTRRILFNLKFPNSFIDSVCFIVGNHMKIKQADVMRVSRIKKILAHPNAVDLLAVSYADSDSGVKDLYWHEYIMSHIEQWTKEQLQPKPILMGADLIAMGLKPSPLFSRVLGAIYDEQLEGTIKTKEEALSKVMKILSEIES